ncbi:MAG: nucleoside-diphosphate-sugar epimerase [Planctomycetota bacterium]|jgi:nucleoside-diphosphate-sugar epimerase
MKHVLVTGGSGYKGAVLVPKLLERGDKVTVIDAMWFGNVLEEHPNLTVIEADVRDCTQAQLDGVHTIIHLANVANDPSADLDPRLSWEVNALGTMQLADNAVRAGVEQFIFASSGSVYGIKDEEHVTEELTLTPISDYNRSKMVAERVLLSYQDDMIVQCLRPATVCGTSSRMRLDVAVNMLTMQALTVQKITVFGGAQVRPNIHIDDVADAYLHLMDIGGKARGIFNAGFENLSVLDIAQRVIEHIPAKIQVTESNDPRSYRLNSDKLLATGFEPRKCVNDAIVEIAAAYRAGKLTDTENCYNVKWMKKRVVG